MGLMATMWRKRGALGSIGSIAAQVDSFDGATIFASEDQEYVPGKQQRLQYVPNKRL